MLGRCRRAARNHASGRECIRDVRLAVVFRPRRRGKRTVPVDGGPPSSCLSDDGAPKICANRARAGGETMPRFRVVGVRADGSEVILAESVTMTRADEICQHTALAFA